MDLRMPEPDGVNAIDEIRAIDPNARIIVLTTYDGDEDIFRGMRAGAKSYLLKDVRREELFQCIREVHARDRHRQGLKGKLSPGLYAVAIGAAFVRPWLAGCILRSRRPDVAHLRPPVRAAPGRDEPRTD
jgi:DNA-binding NarL/FixJ family response regulator